MTVQTTDVAPGRDVTFGLALYKKMLTIRFFEQAAKAARVEGRVNGSVHPYIGQEAIAVGISAALKPQDYVASYHRGHGHAIARGADPLRMMLELFGKQGGMCGGKGGSMHIADMSIGMLGANGVIGDSATIGVGAAQAARMLGKDSIVVVYFGDGGINRGPIMEAFNWSKAFDLPVLFVCEDNKFSYTTRTSSVTGGPGPAARAAGFGLAAETVDGNDVFVVYETAQHMIDRMRTGGGPGFLHAMTYRLGGHIAQDPAHYQSRAEVARAELLDPLIRCKAWLKHQGAEHLAEQECEAVSSIIEEIVRKAEAAPYPDLATCLADNQDLGAPTWG